MNIYCRNHPGKKVPKTNIYCAECLAIKGKELYIEQGGRCAICGTYFSEDGCLINETVPSAAKLDHDHNSGELRGVLCNNCNRGLGLFKDDPILLQTAISYLNRKR